MAGIMTQAEFKSHTMVLELQETLKEEVDKMKYVFQVYALKETVRDDPVVTCSESTVSPRRVQDGLSSLTSSSRFNGLMKNSYVLFYMKL